MPRGRSTSTSRTFTTWSRPAGGLSRISGAGIGVRSSACSARAAGSTVGSGSQTIVMFVPSRPFSSHTSWYHAPGPSPGCSDQSPSADIRSARSLARIVQPPIPAQLLTAASTATGAHTHESRLRPDLIAVVERVLGAVRRGWTRDTKHQRACKRSRDDQAAVHPSPSCSRSLTFQVSPSTTRVAVMRRRVPEAVSCRSPVSAS